MHAIHRIVLAVAVVTTATLVVAACATSENILATSGEGYVGDVARRTADVDWTKAETVRVVLTEFAFRPDHLTFRKGQPYRLVLVNMGSRTHHFTSEGFFRAIAAARLIQREGTLETPRLRTIAMPVGAEKQLDFVPVRAGEFELECTVPLHATFGMTGDIRIL